MLRGKRIERRLPRLMGVRLALTVVILGVALGLDLVGLHLAPLALRGLYATVGFAFLATALSGVAFGRLSQGRLDLLAAAQIPVDVALVTALVHFSGGGESVFIFLYALVTVYGAVLFERRGGFAAATASAVGYGGILFAANAGFLPSFGARVGPIPLAQLGAVWAVHAGALYLVGALASVLSRELHRTGEVLDQRTSDLHRLRDLHQRTVDSIMSGLLTTDQLGRITSFNPEAERITGALAYEVIGRDLEEVIPGAGALLAEEGGAPAAGDSRPQRSRLRYRHREGKDLFLGLAGSILKGRDGASLGHVLIFQDVTQVVGMEEELWRSERLAAVGELSAKIAHEIRNPLAAISGSIQILRGSFSTPAADSEPARLMDIVVRETERLDELITDFLHYARPRPLKLEPVRVDRLAGELAEVFRASLVAGVSLETEPLEAAEACADADQLRQVLWNLCTNAVQAMPEGGCLVLSTRCTGPPAQGGSGTGRSNAAQGGSGTGRSNAAQGGSGTGRNDAEEEACRRAPDWVEISVRDEGVGMSAEVQERIFEPFFTTKQEGTGLGLAMVHRIVEAHGGALQVESRVGEGTCFRVLLPSKAEGSERA